MRWNPWRTLKATPEVFLTMQELPHASGGGCYIPDGLGERALIILDPRLTQVERNCVLAHEWLHHEAGFGCWDPREARRECDRLWDEVARRLVPRDELVRLGIGRAEAGCTFEVADVAEVFHVTPDVARRALLLLSPEERTERWRGVA